MSSVKLYPRKLTGVQKFIGLIGKSKPEAVYLETRWGIHTFFMKFPIDVVVLDEKNKIVKIKRNLKPWRVFFWNPKYWTILEIPSTIAPKLPIRIGDRLNLFPLESNERRKTS